MYHNIMKLSVVSNRPIYKRKCYYHKNISSDTCCLILLGQANWTTALAPLLQRTGPPEKHENGACKPLLPWTTRGFTFNLPQCVRHCTVWQYYWALKGSFMWALNGSTVGELYGSVMWPLYGETIWIHYRGITYLLYSGMAILCGHCMKVLFAMSGSIQV